MLDSENPLLEKGQSLAPVLTTYPLDGLLIGITEYPHQVETGYWHAHKSAMISFVLEGGNIENRKGKQIQRDCGSINFYHACEPHQNVYKVFPSKHLSIEVDGKFLDKYELREHQIHAAIEKNPFGKFLFLKILKEVLVDDSFSCDSIEMLFIELANSGSIPDYTNRLPAWVPVLKNLLNDNWNRQLSLEELSAETGLHPVTISGNFRKYFSSTYGEYMRKIKINRSLKMIRNPDKHLTEIAHACGFADQSHFTRTFKNQVGFLPKQFQKL